MRFTLNIPKPCHEDWDAMSERSGARFCASCQHEVADLSRATDAELLALFTSDARPTCARFDPRQLDRVLGAHEARQRRGLPIAAFTSLLAIAIGQETLAQAPPVKEPRTEHTMPHSVGKPLVTRTPAPATAERTITGRVVESDSGTPVHLATITVTGSRYSAVTDTAGRFTLALPASLDGTIQLACDLPGFLPLRKDLALPVGTDSHYLDIGQVELEPNRYMLGEVEMRPRR